MDYRKKIKYSLITIPEGIVNEDRGLSECCCKFTAIADVESSDVWKNDVRGVFVKKSAISDTVTFKIFKCGNPVALSNLGETAVFPNEPLGVGFIYDWRQYLITEGAGEYEITVEFTISGITGGFSFGHYNLNQYTTERLDTTVRIWTEFNSYSLQERFDFTNSNFKDSIRVSGLFGLAQPAPEVNNLITKGRKVVKTTREFVKKYELICDPLTSCESTRILDFHLLNGDDYFISDHNKCNHSYQYLHFPVSVDGDISSEYPENARLMRLNCTFGDTKKTKKSMYNV
jgi:hypothetical protein